MARNAGKGTGRPLSVALAAATLLLAGLLIWQCVDIYLTGAAPENLDESSVRVRDIYSREIVSEHLSEIRWAVWAYLAILAAAWVEREARGPGSASRESGAAGRIGSRTAKWESKGRGKSGAIPVAVLAAAMGLIALGVMNGGMRDVLAKAVNICTECVGLG